MRHVKSTSQFSVYDDALSSDEHKAIWRSLQHETYAPVMPSMGVYRVDDGQALRCTKSYLWTDPHAGRLPPEEQWKARLVPSGDQYSPVLAHFAEIGSQHEALIGVKGRDWVAIILTPHLYKRGDAVSWHTDGFTYTGAFAYHAHPQWNCLWGGELLIVDDTTERDPRNYDRRCLLDNVEENERLMEPGFGHFIFPKPNRLVFIAGGNEHMVSKVHDAAGNHVRASFAGFFLRSDAVNGIKQQSLV